ncbi:hypothetical protein IVA87_07790 [Bradyrhizobium sp. 147]|uniref:hypothetical protein n=1 Tax=Bradyrhizobium sp. 147 TaxID=2782623 RepID=UPI001FFA96DC|nr:hypothetical protein [Bradyrhizobium sp. 147]MCK1679363.1 hypothetical protein [Bradyrhizobium sp. 147]
MMLWMVSVLERSTFQSFSAVDKKPAKRAPLSRATQLAVRFLPAKTIGGAQALERESRISITMLLGGHDSSHSCETIHCGGAPACDRHATVDPSCCPHRSFWNEHQRLQSSAVGQQLAVFLAGRLNLEGIAQTETEFSYQF